MKTFKRSVKKTYLLLGLALIIGIAGAVFAPLGPARADDPPVDPTRSATPASSPSGTEIDSGANAAVVGILDDFNRPNGPIGTDWTNRVGAFNVVNNAAQGGSTALATFNGATSDVLEGDVAVNGTGLQYTALVLGYGSITSNLFIKVQGSGTFTNAACYVGNNGFSSFGLAFFSLSAPFATAHMRVELAGTTVTLTFSNINGGTGTQQYVCNNAPATGGNGIGIGGFVNLATMDNFAAGVPTPPPGETFTFPATGDPRSTEQWMLGNFVEGTRTLVNPASTVDMILLITNALTCDTQDHVLKVDGLVVGSFIIAPGATAVVDTFNLPGIAAGSHTFRIENVRTVNAGCGNATFPNGVSTLTFSTVQGILDGPWQQFAFTGVGTPATGCAPADPLGAGCTPSSGGNSVFATAPPWTFTAPQGGAALFVTDAFERGDKFLISDFGIGNWITSQPLPFGTCGDDPEPCFDDPLNSSGGFPLGGGPHSITITAQAVSSPATQAAYFKVVSNSPIQNPANGHFYQLVEIPGTSPDRPGIDWFTANASATALTFQGLPGHLVTITSQAEGDFIANNFPSVVFRWIGGFQAPGSPEPAGGWEWVTGEPFVYTNWFQGGPDNLGTNEDGIQLCCLPDEVFWNDAARTNTALGYIVEYEVPPPCTLDLALSYTAPTLTLDFTVGNLVAVTGSAWLVSQNSAALLGSIGLAINDPPISLSFPISVPVQGGVGILATLTTTTDGIICSTWMTIDTGP